MQEKASRRFLGFSYRQRRGVHGVISLVEFDDTLCPLCMLFMSDILTNSTAYDRHPRDHWLMVKEGTCTDRIITGFAHHHWQYFFETDRIGCHIYLLLADRLRQRVPSNDRAMIIFYVPERYDYLRAGFGVVNTISNGVSFFAVYHNPRALSPSSPHPVNLERTLRFILISLECCMQQHLERKRKTSELPTRVIDVSLSDGIENVCVCNHEPMGIAAQYTALSGGLRLPQERKGKSAVQMPFISPDDLE